MTPALLTFLLVFAGILGLVIGSFLNVVIYRVPAGIPLTRESRCPHCATTVRAWQNIPVLSWLLLRGRCAGCKAPISPRYSLVELATGVAFVGVAWWSIDTWVGMGPIGAYALTVAFLYFAAISIALALIDFDVRRLPNAIVLPAYPVMLVLLLIASVCCAQWDAMLRAGIGGVALFAFYLLLRLIRPGGMGGGDVKLAGVLGIALGWIGWGALIVGAFAGFVVGGIVGIALMVGRHAGRKSAIPFGPWMLVGAWIGILAGQDISRWYLGLLTAA